MKTAFRISLLALASLSLLSACGGGGGSTTAQPGAGTTAGTISGLGSVVVNGVRYETIGASVSDADTGSAINDPLGIGMNVSIDPSSTNSATASIIHIQSGIQGGILGLNASTQTLNVAGLPVTTDTSTLVVTASGLTGSFSDLAVSQNVEVHGLPQSDGTFKATRIEIKTIAHNIQLVGVVSNFNSSTNTFTLGNGVNAVTVNYAPTNAPTSLANGAVVSMHTATTVGATNYTATRVYLRSTSTSTYTEYTSRYAGTSGLNNEANELYGMVSNKATTSSGCTLQVQGVTASISNTALCAAIQNGDYIQVKGLLTNGTLAAHRIEFRTAGTDRDLSSTGYADDANDRNQNGLKYSRLPNSTNGTSSYEIYGTLSNCPASNSPTCTITIRGTTDAFVADLSTAAWEHLPVTSGSVEAKGYVVSPGVFKVLKIERKS